MRTIEEIAAGVVPETNRVPRWFLAVLHEAHALGAAEMREKAARIADGWAASYPVDVFPADGTSLDAKAARHGRHVASCIAGDIRKEVKP